MNRLLWLIWLIGCVGVANAAFYKCTSPGGEVVFTDKPCIQGASEILAKYSKTEQRFVSGRFNGQGLDFRVVDGAAFWVEEGRILSIVLAPAKLSDEDAARLAAGDDGWLAASDLPGYARVQLKLEDAIGQIGTINHMQIVVMNLDGAPRVSWTSSHGENEIKTMVSRYAMDSALGAVVLSLAAAESSGHTDWNYTVRLRLEAR